MFDSIVPEEFRKDLPPGTAIGAKQVFDVLQRVAEQKPELYKKISHELLKLGGRGSVETETSFGLEDLKSPIDKPAMLKAVELQEQAIAARKDLTPDQKRDELVKLYFKLSNDTPGRIFDAAMSKGSNLARMVASGARGNKQQLSSNIGADWLIIDSEGRPVPVPLKNNYAEGLSPAEYFGSTYGTRQGLVSTKLSVAQSGFMAKQMSSAAQDLTVTEEDCGTSRGIAVDTDDGDNVGALLAKPYAGYQPGTPIDKGVFSDLKSRGLKKIVVRSPMTCQAKHGLCAACAGVRERGTLPPIGENIGIAAASAVSEPLSQALLSSKHSAGVANAGKAARIGGFQAINALFQSPKTFPDGAAVASRDGKVTRIDKAPQGGHYIEIDGERHYSAANREPGVKLGQTVEAGQALDDGVVSPADAVKYRGVGEGRRYFLNQLRTTLKDNGIGADRRNLEVLARASINHVQIDDPDADGDMLPDDIVRYDHYEHNYTPPKTTQTLPVDKAVGKYLQRPVLHYSLGTRITPGVAQELKDVGETDIDVDDEAPKFASHMVRLMENPSYGSDWMSQLGSSYVKGNLLDNVHRGGATSNIHGASPLPGLAYGMEFGKPKPGGAY